MLINKISEIKQKDIDFFYEEKNPGVILIKKENTFLNDVFFDKSGLKKKDFENINLLQESISRPKISKNLEKIFLDISKKFDFKIFFLDYSLTRYNTTKKGSEFHLDFSRNRNVIVTIFWGNTDFFVAKDKSGLNKKKFSVKYGDILIMRAPRNDSEKELRSVHAIGEIKKSFYTLEFRNVLK